MILSKFAPSVFKRAKWLTPDSEEDFQECSLDRDKCVVKDKVSVVKLR